MPLGQALPKDPRAVCLLIREKPLVSPYIQMMYGANLDPSVAMGAKVTPQRS